MTSTGLRKVGALAEQLGSSGEARGRIRSATWLTGVLLFQAVALGWYALKEYYFVDDFVHFMFAAGPLTIDYLTQPVFQHLIPGYRLIYWILQHRFTMNYAAAVTCMVLFHALSSVVMFRLLRRFCGVNVSGVLVLIWAVSPIHLRLTNWAAAGIEYFPCNLFSLLAIDRMLAYWSQGRKRDLGLSLLGLVLGLSFFIKALLVVGYLGLLWILFPRLRPQEHARSRTLASLAGSGLVAGLYLLVFLKYYYFGMNMGDSPKPTALEALGFIGEGIVRVFLPSYAGVSSQSTAAFLIFGGVLAAAFLGACLWVRGAWRVAVFFVLAAAPNLAIVAITRMKILTDGVALSDLRYYAEVSYLFTLALGLLVWLMPRKQPSPGAAAMARGPGLRAEGLAVLVLGLCVGRAALLERASKTTSYWDTSVVKAYMMNLMAGLKEVRHRHAGHYEQYAFFNATMPAHMMPDWFGAFNSYGEFFMFLDSRIQTDVPASAMYVIDHLGRVRPAEFAPLGEMVLEQGKACLSGGEAATYSLPESVDVKEGSIELEFDQPIALWGAIQLSADTAFEKSRFRSWNRDAKAGSSYVTFSVKEPLRHLRLSFAGNSNEGCVKRIRVGSHRLDPVTAFPSASAQF